MHNYTPDCLAELEHLYTFFKANSKKKTLSNFCNELLITGWNVCKAIEEYNVTPHVINEHMVALYTHSDAFIYECIVAGLEIDKLNKDKFIINYLKQNFNQSQLKILCYADGAGLDTQFHAENGHLLTYFDFESLTSEFAQHRIGQRGLVNDVEFIFREEQIPIDRYDVVICREVLEHLDNLWGYLNKDGICFLSESFSRVEKSFPTHLASNLKYVGKTIDIMVREGFRYIDRFEDSNLLVFKKTKKNDNLRFNTLPKIPLKRRLKKKLKDKLMYYLN